MDALPLYLTISEGPRADRTRPVLALADQRLIADLLRRLGRLPESRGEPAEDEDAPDGSTPAQGRGE